MNHTKNKIMNMELSANELRIGNLVWWGDGPIEIDVNTLFHFSTYRGIKPIELTKEWFERLGFEYIEMMFDNIPMIYWKKGFMYIELELLQGLPRYVINLYNIKQDGYLVEVKYVHNIQNWWRILTGEELKIKELT